MKIHNPDHLQNRRRPSCLEKGRDHIDRGKGKAEKWPMAMTDTRVGSSFPSEPCPAPALNAQSIKRHQPSPETGEGGF